METTIPPSPQRTMQTMACLEMELDHSDHDEYDDHHHDTAPLTSSRGGNQNHTATNKSAMVELAQGLVTYIKLWAQLYPKTSWGIGGVIALIFLYYVTPLSSLMGGGKGKHHVDMTRNHLERDYTSVTTEFEELKSNIHHWCLFGGNDNCKCEDPTVGLSREEIPGWSTCHADNKRQVSENQRVQQGDQPLDVVFVGDQTFQAWGQGQLLDRPFDEGPQIAAYFNQTFRSSDSDYQGVSLGIYTDRTTNLLWRIKHGEMPDNLQAKVFWILIGANDLALAMCSEDVVLLGILRVAEEIAFANPNAKIVIQGLLPRSNHRDGSLHITDDKKGSSFRHNQDSDKAEKPFDKNNIWSFRTDKLDPNDLDPGHSTLSSALQQAKEQAQQPYFDYYIWPSILAINQALKKFCDTDPHQFIYYDADDLFVETVPGAVNDEKRILKDLMPNSILLSYKGHQVLMDAVKTKLDELLSR